MTASNLTPSISVGIKLASIAVHADEATSGAGHPLDVAAIRGLLTDPEVVAYLAVLSEMALLPVKR